jgi:hypothetical protein
MKKQYDLSDMIIDKEKERADLIKKAEKEGVEIVEFNGRKYIDIEGVSKLYNLRDVKLITKKRQLDFDKGIKKAVKTITYSSGRTETKSTLYSIDDIEKVKDKFFKINDRKDFIAFNK